MESIVIIILLIVIVLIVFAKYLQSIETKRQLPYAKKQYLNIPERRFYNDLLNITPEGYIVFPQVLVSSIVMVTSGKNFFWTWQNKINRKTIDFVIFNKQYLQPVIAIEYDGKTHERPDRKERDDFLKEVLTGAGVTSIHFRHNYSDIEELKIIIQERLSTGL